MKTAVEWLGEELKSLVPKSLDILAKKLIEQAKELEKQQIVDAKDCWFEDERDGEEYYKQTFKK
jgi:hypothetical protein